jgi:hypothetical protein
MSDIMEVDISELRVLGCIINTNLCVCVCVCVYATTTMNMTYALDQHHFKNQIATLNENDTMKLSANST